MSVFLQLKHLRKSTNAGEHLFDIDEFSIRENTCIVLSGGNGAGKTTLLKILAGLDKPIMRISSMMMSTCPEVRTAEIAP